MENTTIINVNEIVRKLHPASFLNISGKMVAILGALLKQHWTNPRLVEICATSDGMVVGRTEDDYGMNEFFGRKEDLDRNLRGMCAASRTRCKVEDRITQREEEFLLALCPQF
jgi:hypothetical protein